MAGRVQKRIEEVGKVARGEVYGVTIRSGFFKFTRNAAYWRYCSHDNRGSVKYSAPNEDVALQILQAFVASATLENLCFKFYDLKPDDEIRLMRAVCPVVCTSRSLATLSLSFRKDPIFDRLGSWLLAAESGVRHFLETGFPVLSRDNPVFCKLTVEAEAYTSIKTELVCCPCRRLELHSFSRNQVKDSNAGWTLVMSHFSNPHMHPEICSTVQDMFALFPANNGLLKGVVLTMSSCREPSCGRCPEDVVNLVARNVTMLERLDVGEYHTSCQDYSQAVESVATALRSNRSLKKFEYRCTLAELHELVQVFVPDRGREYNSSLSTLKVHIAGSVPMVDCMIALAPLHGATVAALKEVIVCGDEEPWEFTVSSDDSQPHPNVGGVTLSRLKVRLPQLVGYNWYHGKVLKSLIVMEEVLRMSTALAQVEIYCYPLGGIPALQRTGSSSDLQPNLPSSFSTLKLHLSPLDYRPAWTSERSAARPWMTVVKKSLRVVATLERVEAVHEPGRLAPCEFERGVQGKVRKGLKRLEKELRGNTCLQSLQVGWWRLVRVGAGDDEWEMRYDGPCLRRPDEYHVVVELQRKHEDFGLPS